MFKMDNRIFLRTCAGVQNSIKQFTIITVALKEKTALKHIKYAYIDFFRNVFSVTGAVFCFLLL